MKKISVIFIAVLLLVGIVGCSNSASKASEGNEKPKKITLDYAFYSPTSLVLKEFGWAEEVFEEEGIEVEFVLSQGSNKALEFLNSGSADFGSSAGAAALMAKANGAPIESVYLYSKPEWTALVVNKDSDIQNVSDLKGKKIAATIGTDPYIFLLRALSEEGLSPSDVEIVNLQHGDGAAALSSGQIDAWSGLDPHMARVELETDAKLFYRNADFNTYGTLNVRSEFAEKYPEYVEKVIEVYEKARAWTLENPEEATEILAKAANIDLEVAKKQFNERNDFSNPVPGEIQIEALTEAGKVLQEQDIIKKDVELDKLVQDLINPTFAEKVIKQ
ncbi:aliphatic sulfonate ABC transporter substrate-binding protein [Bacillus nitroreducens]